MDHGSEIQPVLTVGVDEAAMSESDPWFFYERF